jgi:hypothetical protein
MALLGGRGVAIVTGDEVVVDADAQEISPRRGAGPALAPRRVGRNGWRNSPTLAAKPR